jgi:hypothetical protein
MATAAIMSLYALVQKQQAHLCRLAAETLGFICSHGELHTVSVRRNILKVGSRLGVDWRDWTRLGLFVAARQGIVAKLG